MELRVAILKGPWTGLHHDVKLFALTYTMDTHTHIYIYIYI